MNLPSRRALPGALVLVSLCLPATAAAVPVTVNLRVEGPTSTVFDGPVTTDGHDVTTAAGGTQKCDGTNGAAEPTPGPTATAALDDAARQAGFTIDGPYGNFGIDDFFLERVGNQFVDPNTAYWGLWTDFKFSDKGGCQKRVSAGQDVLWAGIPFAVSTPLELQGPASATVGVPVSVRVIDGEKGSPQAGASVGGAPGAPAVTGTGGRASLSFAKKGIYRLKADKPDTIRSNTIVMCVDPAGAAVCSSTDSSGPTVEALFSSAGSPLPGKTLASSKGRSRTILVSWAGADGAGSGVAYYSVEVRRLAGGAGADQAQSGEWRELVGRAPVNGVHFRGDAGAAYGFRITAFDRALNATTLETEPVLIPVDDRSRRLWRFSKGWKRRPSESAWGGSVIRPLRKGATARLRFSGTELALLGRKLPRGGRLRVSVDGRARTLRLRGRSVPRGAVWTARGLSPGVHTLRLRSLGGGRVELDGVAIAP